jgi:hypothetical protein
MGVFTDQECEVPVDAPGATSRSRSPRTRPLGVL